MCRDGYSAPCQEEGCEAIVHCRERLCPDHDLDLSDLWPLGDVDNGYVGRHRDVPPEDFVAAVVPHDRRILRGHVVQRG